MLASSCEKRTVIVTNTYSISEGAEGVAEGATEQENGKASRQIILGVFDTAFVLGTDEDTSMIDDLLFAEHNVLVGQTA